MTGLTSALLAATFLFAAASTSNAAEDSGTPAAERVWTHDQLRKVAGQPVGRELAKVGDEAYYFAFTSPGITSTTSVLISRQGTDYLLKSAHVDLHRYYHTKGKEGVEKRERKLTAAEWNGVQAKLRELDFWNYETPVTAAALDGTFWTLDGAAGEKYRAVTENAPDAGKYRAAALHVWRLSGEFMGNWADVKQ